MPTEANPTMTTLRPSAACFHPRKQPKVVSATTEVSSTAIHKSKGLPLRTSSSATTRHKQPQHASSSRGQTSPPSFQSTHFAAPPPQWLTADYYPAGVVDTGRFTLEGLGAEVQAFIKYNRLTSEEIAARERLVADVRSVTESLWGSGARVVVFGSYALDLSLSSSDVDLAVVLGGSALNGCEVAPGLTALGDEEHHPERVSASPLDALHVLAKRIVEHAPRLQAQVIDQCRVPVIQVYDSWTAVRCDISMTQPKMDLVVAKQRHWLHLNPVAHDLILITKAALKQWGLNAAFTGGLSSTCVYSLVHRFLAEGSNRAPHASMPSIDGGHKTGSCAAAAATTPQASRCESPAGVTNSPTSSADFDDCVADVFDQSRSRSSTAVPSSRGSSNPTPDQEMPSVIDEDLRIEPFATSGATPKEVGTQLLEFWHYLSSDVFLCGYQLTDAFLPDDDAVTLTKMSLNDLSKTAFRVDQIHFLLKHSLSVLKQLLGPRELPVSAGGSSSSVVGNWCTAFRAQQSCELSTGGRSATQSTPPPVRLPSLLSPILADPRLTQPSKFRGGKS